MTLRIRSNVFGVFRYPALREVKAKPSIMVKTNPITTCGKIPSSCFSANVDAGGLFLALFFCLKSTLRKRRTVLYKKQINKCVMKDNPANGDGMVGIDAKKRIKIVAFYTRVLSGLNQYRFFFRNITSRISCSRKMYEFTNMRRRYVGGIKTISHLRSLMPA